MAANELSAAPCDDATFKIRLILLMHPERQNEEVLVRAGRALGRTAPAIVETWMDRVGVASSGGSKHRELMRDHLPQLLERMGRDLVRRGGGQSEATEDAAEQHGRQRWQLGWQLQDVVVDYQTLRPVLHDSLKEEFGDPLPSPVSSAISTMIDEAIVDSLRCYREFRSAQEDESYRTASEFAAIVSSSTDAIIGISPEGIIKSWNNAAAKLYGYTQREALGEHVSLLFPAELRHELAEILESIGRNQALASRDTSRLTKSGERRAVASSVSPVCDRTGTVTGCAAIERDISDRVRASDELRKACTAAEAASRAKSEFLANVSHELRTPMNAIIGMTSLTLEEQGLSSRVRENLNVARDAAHVMLRLVNNLLDVSKLESGEPGANESPFSLKKLIDDTIKLSRARGHQKGLQVSWSIDQVVPDRLSGDALALQQILANLIDNAIKFTAEGQVALEVSLDACHPTSCGLLFTVRDTGVGIATTDQKRIFDPFTQVEASSTRRFGGAGLGLTIASRLTQRLGGQLSVESKQGEGSVFRLSVTMMRHRAPLPANPATLTQKLQGMRVLLVDDEHQSPSPVKHLCETWGMQPVTAATAADAQALLSQDDGRGFDLAVIDAQAPPDGGFSLADSIASAPLPQPVVLLKITPEDRLEFKEQCEQSQVDALIDEPLDASDFLETILEGLSSKRQDGGKMESSAPRGHAPHALRILIVEDTEANRRVAMRVLSKRGHDLTVAINGQQAVELFRDHVFDVILMDVQMPVMDGFQATEAIREIEAAQPTRRPTPIVAMTAHALWGDRERCLAAGMNDYIAKPIEVASMIHTVERVAQTSKEADMPRIDSESSAPQETRRLGEAEEINLDAALKRLRGDRGLFGELVQCFLEDYPQLLDDFKDALASEDYRSAARAAHSLKGLASTFEAKTTPTVAARCQHLAQSSDAEKLAELTPQLEKGCEDLAALLRSLDL